MEPQVGDVRGLIMTVYAEYSTHFKFSAPKVAQCISFAQLFSSWRNCQDLVTIVIVGSFRGIKSGGHSAEAKSFVPAVVVYGTALCTAVAAFAVPGPASDLTGLATLLAFAAVALCAGNQWGEYATIGINVAVAARVFPEFVSQVDSLSGAATALGIATVFSVPNLVLLASRAPGILAMVIGSERPALLRLAAPTLVVAAISWVFLPTANLVASKSANGSVLESSSPRHAHLFEGEDQPVRAALYRDSELAPTDGSNLRK